MSCLFVLIHLYLISALLETDIHLPYYQVLLLDLKKKLKRWKVHRFPSNILVYLFYHNSVLFYLSEQYPELCFLEYLCPENDCVFYLYSFSFYYFYTFYVCRLPLKLTFSLPLRNVPILPMNSLFYLLWFYSIRK